MLVASQVPAQSIVEQKSFSVRGGLSGGLDLGVGSQKEYLNPSLTYYELTSLNEKKSLLIGWTAQVSAFYGHNLDYYTAPARLTRLQNIDTVRFAYLTQTALNLGIRAEVNLGRLQLGASLDLVGFTALGRARTGRVFSSTGLFSGKDSLDQTSLKPFKGEDAYQSARPTRFNLKLLGDHDRGMLTTEVYARLYLRPNLDLKLGYH
jgi:hypothetical protein